MARRCVRRALAAHAGVNCQVCVCWPFILGPHRGYCRLAWPRVENSIKALNLFAGSDSSLQRRSVDDGEDIWLNDGQWSAIDVLLPRDGPGAHQVDERRVVSGIVHVLKAGCRWEDCPAVYGPSTTVYNSFNGGLDADFARPVRRPGGKRGSRCADHRQHDGQGPPLGRGRGGG